MQNFDAKSANKRLCRICFDEGDEENDNPLINPSCSCKGSVEYIHEDCLIKENTCKQYFITKQYGCSICHRTITAYSVRETYPLTQILYGFFIRLLLTVASVGSIYWMAINQNKPAKKLISTKIYDYFAIFLAVVAFIMSLRLVMFFFNEIFTGRRRIKF